MNPQQRAIVRRKVIYFAAILALFTLSIFYRGLEARANDGRSYVWLPFGNDYRANAPNPVARGADWLAGHTILSQSRRLEIRELEQGEPDLTGSFVRLGLTGSRGFVVTVLWQFALDKQKRNDFHEFEQYVKQVTMLQPHFITPWIFQSWNIAYNISVEMHSLGDMYFYIARGIDLLAEGERRNSRSPDMRYQLAFYYQNKFGVSDQVQTLRCLFQLSNIPPAERNIDRGGGLVNEDGTVDMAGFKQFCEKHPSLVRRLRGAERQDRDKKSTHEGLRAADPKDVVQFLRDNKSVPSRFKTATAMNDAEKQFPILPPKFNEGPDEYNPSTPPDDAFSGYLAARAWFTYANALVPPNPTDPNGNPIPSSSPKPGTGPDDYDPVKYRMPKMPMLIIFRQGPPRAQSYQAEMMQKDGWFDGDGWEVDAGVDTQNAWFTEAGPGGVRQKQAVVIGRGLAWSQGAWEKAASLWDVQGTRYALRLDENQLKNLRAAAGLSEDSDAVGGLPPEPTLEQWRDEPALARQMQARRGVFFYHQNRSLTNFAYYLASAEAEKQPQTIQARKTLWKADQQRRLGNKVAAAKLYKQGLEEWKLVLINNPSFHRPANSDRVEEETYEYEIEYIRLIAQDSQEVRDQAKAAYLADYRKAAGAAVAVVPFLGGLPESKAIPETLQTDLYMDAAEKLSPFYGVMVDDRLAPSDPRRGTPWIRDAARQTIESRQGITRKSEK